jgi:hypothetical protein
MRSPVSFRRIATAAALALLWLGGPASADSPDAFRVSGTFVVVATEANRFELTHSGLAVPGGPVTGTVSGRRLAAGRTQVGTGTFDFGGGDTLSWEWHLELDPRTGLLVGTYEVTGGTGMLAEATGSGSLIVDPAGDGTGEYHLSGTLSF